MREASCLEEEFLDRHPSRRLWLDEALPRVLIGLERLPRARGHFLKVDRVPGTTSCVDGVCQPRLQPLASSLHAAIRLDHLDLLERFVNAMLGPRALARHPLIAQ